MDDLLDILGDSDTEGMIAIADAVAEFLGENSPRNAGILKESLIGGALSIPVNLMTGQDVGRSLFNSGVGAASAYGLGTAADMLAQQLPIGNKGKYALTAAGELLGLIGGNLLTRQPREEQLLQEAMNYAQQNPQRMG